MSEAQPWVSPPAPQPPDPSAGQRRPPSASSSPNGKGDRETQHTKKKSQSMCSNTLFAADDLIKDLTTTESEATADVTAPLGSTLQPKIPPSA
ncbi:unnamed protein product [Linum trigynum]|uniref:Uncharacterized protein n=1 Tax=Linum trigynum TaxID=586398 RepID=A0AAV2CUC5_9ROSI